MTQVHLQCHPARMSNNVAAVDVRMSLTQDGLLTAVYTLSGSLTAVLLPDVTEPTRRDGLWQDTCAELFLRQAGSDDSYLEFNFSPSTAWAAYEFEGYRSGMNTLDLVPPHIETSIRDDVMEMRIALTLPAAWQLSALLVGASFVIAEENGMQTYWAIVHPPGKPDFHHRDCFALHLEARSAA